MVLLRLQQIAGGAQSAVHAVEGTRSPRGAVAALHGPPASVRQGHEGIAARRDAMVAAAAPGRARRCVSLQLQRLRSRAHSVHERRDQERVCLSESWTRGIGDGDRGRALRISCGVGGRRSLLDYPQRADFVP